MKRFVFFICLILSYTCVIANTPDLKKTHDDNTKILLDNCSLPAPTGFVGSITPQNLVNLTWNAVPGAVDYEIKTIQFSTGIILNTTYTTNTSIVINPGPPQSYTFEVRAGCGLSQYSDNFARTQLSIEWVIDLVIDRKDSEFIECELENHIINGHVDFPFTPNKVYFAKIFRLNNDGSIGGDLEKFQFGIVQNRSHIIFKEIITPIYGQLATPACQFSGTGLPEIRVAECLQNPIPYIKISIGKGWAPSLIVTDIDQIYNYSITLLSDCSEGRSSLSTDTEQELQVSATPNPFTNEINLYFTDVESEHNTTIQLFDLTGKLHYSKLSGLSTNQVTIPTSELPTGIYILRTQTADRVQTIKMIKTE